MKMTIHPTSQMTNVNGVPCRVWEGETENGTAVFALVTRVAAHESQNLAELESALNEVEAPTVSNVFPARLIL